MGALPIRDFPDEEGLSTVARQERIIAPEGCSWVSFFLDGPTLSDDFLAKQGSQEQADRESF